MPKPTPFTRFMDTNGDGTGSSVGNIDASTPVEFLISPVGGERIDIQQVVIRISGVGTSILGEEYGVIPELATGIELGVKDMSGDIFKFILIKNNIDWSQLAIAKTEQLQGSTDRTIMFTTVGFAQSIRLKGSAGHELFIRLRDDFLGLTAHTFLAFGTSSDTY